MRRASSQPAISRKKVGSGSSSGEQKEKYARALALYKDFQSGLDLSNGYKLGHHIAAGADGDVFRGMHLVDRKEVAVKRIKVASSAIQRHIQQEVTAAFHARKKYVEEAGDFTAVGHPCIVAYLDWFAGSGGIEREVCIVMDLCNFGIGDLIYTGSVMRTEYDKYCKSQASLEQLKAPSVRAKAPALASDPRLYRFTEREICKVMLQMLSALAFLNRHGIFHRDVKSENILWQVGVPEGNYKLADFGVAFCEADCDPSKKFDDCGTLWTMAPELLGRRNNNISPGPSCDTWSLGVVLFEMSFYEKPFSSMELLAYRNGGVESRDGFWACMCGPPAKRVPTPQNSPKPTRRVLSKQGSTPSLPSVSVKTGASESAPASPQSAASSAGGRTPRRLLRSPSNPSISPKLNRGLLRAKTLEVATADEEPLSPTTAVDRLKLQKRMFLRRRGALKWIYSEELRNFIFEDMLEEDVTTRPTPAELLANEKVQVLLASYDTLGWGLGSCGPKRGEVIENRAQAVSNASDRPVSAGGTGCRNAENEEVDDPELTAVFAGFAPTAAKKTLREMTPENFLAVLKSEKNQAAAVAAGASPRPAAAGASPRASPRPSEKNQAAAAAAGASPRPGKTGAEGNSASEANSSAV